MRNSRIKAPNDITHTSKSNFTGVKYSNDQLLLSSKEIINNEDKKENNSMKKENKENKENEGNDFYNFDTSIKNKIDIDFLSIDSKFWLERQDSDMRKKNLIKEKTYIVDNIDNIFTKFSGKKYNLIIQEYVLYGIVLLVRIYFWIFLFLTTTKFERNYCYSSIYQFDC